MINPQIFRDYDIRAIIPDELDDPGLKRLIQAVLFHFKPQKIALGFDARLTGPKIHDLFKEIALKAGLKVASLGPISTDMMTFAAGKLDFDLAIMITASHNPSEYNGFKMAQRGGKGVSGDTGFYQIRDLALSGQPIDLPQDKQGQFTTLDIYKQWVDFCFSKAETDQIKPLTVVIDTGNGISGQLFSHPYLQEKLPIKIIPLFFEPDGRFPNHIPNPLKTENRQALEKAVRDHQADLGVILDGDGDRIAFTDENGQFVPGDITTAIVAERILNKNPGATILYNATCGRIVPEKVSQKGGQSKRVRVGYSLIEKEMAATGAVFAGEHSCHYFYKETFNSEASLLTLLHLLAALSESDQKMSEFLVPYRKYFPSGEINFETEDKEKIMKTIAQKYQSQAEKIDWLDGVSIWFPDYWVSLRASNTQPLLRLNLEANSPEILKEKTAEYLIALESLGAKKSTD